VRAASAALALTALLAGCGSGGSGTSSTVAPQSGKTLYVAQCGACHVLADAGTEGSVGKSLDVVRPSYGAVLTAIADGPGAMPEELLRGRDAREVAAYVAGVAGR
jgi:mono/diheme cytochrome c family protein